MIEGDLLAEETDSPYEWMNALAEQERAAYIEPGLWIAAEGSGNVCPGDGRRGYGSAS